MEVLFVRLLYSRVEPGPGVDMTPRWLDGPNETKWMTAVALRVEVP